MTQRPNILLLYSDQHAALAGCYGDPVVRTPNLDALAARGVTFDNCYCPSPICLPSRMSFLTGQEPHRLQCWVNQDIMHSGVPTFAHALGAAGYETRLVGRMHSLGPDQTRGYATRMIGDHSPNWPGGPAHDLGPLDKANDPWRESLTASGPGRSAYESYDRAVTDAAIGSLDELGRRKAAGDDTPFALTVGWILPHAPYVCDPALYESYRGMVPPPALGPPGREHPHHRWWRHDRGIADAAPEDVERARTAYYGLVTAMDAMIGEVLAALSRAGLGENTLVIYTSDHGEHLGNRGLWWKSTLFDEAARVPLIMAWPGTIEPGRRRRTVVSQIDLTATMLDCAGAPALPNAQGRSFAPMLADPSAPWVDAALCEYVNDGIAAWTGGKRVIQRMIRTGRFKYVYHHGEPEQLFNMRADPAETEDLAGDPGHAAVCAALRARVLSDWDPDAIAGVLETRAAEQDLLRQWTRAVAPAEIVRWQMAASDSWLTDPNEGPA
ncbi:MULTISPECIES: sulfatase-like hydrolase/transferase [unclassified Roseitalea]|uniref:sulfatase-like hydrolase/transferase n=1 Tax=unclassified Roseitalea TaxID=2639107 RepID=UPI0027403004|nr:MULTISPECIES: sulfatase-like hydrolase/transferase [unclassified Roseitalea]